AAIMLPGNGERRLSGEYAAEVGDSVTKEDSVSVGNMGDVTVERESGVVLLRLKRALKDI
ncbi:hypothetical protein GGI11_007728, partial [Coemansia sp. RSA 2049]